jgi:hypothetical protein
MIQVNGMRFDKRLKKVHVLSFVYKKLNALCLTQFTSEIFLPVVLINLNSFLRWAPREVSLFFGTVLFSLAK